MHTYSFFPHPPLIANPIAPLLIQSIQLLNQLANRHIHEGIHNK